MENNIKNRDIRFIKIENGFAEALARVKLSPNESRVMWAIVRKTLGWHKDVDAVSLSQLSKITGIIDRANVLHVVNRLVSKKIVFKTKSRIANCYEINKNYEDWPTVVNTDNTPSVDVVQKYDKVLSYDTTKVLSTGTNTKEKRKTKEQKTIYSDRVANKSARPPSFKRADLQELVRYYKELYKERFGEDPLVGQKSWGVYGKLFKGKVDSGYTLVDIKGLLKIFSESDDANPNRLGFELKIFLSDAVFNKMLSKRQHQNRDYSKEQTTVLKAYEKCKKMQLKGDEIDDVMPVINKMLSSGRKVEEILDFMRWIYKNRLEYEMYPWLRMWTIGTVRKKLPEFLGGGLKVNTLEDGYEEIKVR